MMSTQLVGGLIPCAKVTHDGIQEMFHLFKSCFEDAKLSIFERDFRNKQWVIQLRDHATQVLQGFSTLACYHTWHRGEQLGVIFSGDTIVRPVCWGTTSLLRTWIKTVLELTEELPKPVYWLLLSSGYRTYRFLPVFFREFHPRYDQPTPPYVQSVIDELATARFGDEYHADLGIVRFVDGATPLRPTIAEIDERRLCDPHIAFFVRANPGHARGDELVCLAELNTDNLTRTGIRMVR